MSAVIGPTDDIAACQALRRTVFVEEQGVSLAEELDGCDAGAHHILAQVQGVPMGTARILLKGDTGKIGRVCVLSQYRGTGLGAALVLACMDHLRHLPGLTRAELGAQTHALGFYEQLGFKAYGPVYDDAGLAHRDMERAL
ncbi:MAG: GNAT family N-acetyltransferase [Roseovarius sp.]|nr:GNAT family N-acetyltransferase [Roseovarius sp.]